MIDYTESFQDFASRMKPSDLALYAGAAVVVWILFKDKLSPVQKVVMNLVDKIKGRVNQSKSLSTNDVFFELVSSWKQTRDLAVKSGCTEAVRVADEMFPFLSPTVCKKEGDV